MQYSFSPLRYWGGLYHYIGVTVDVKSVLVPFDIGVVYIEIVRKDKKLGLF